MKNRFALTQKRRQEVGRVRRKPLRSFRELAEEFGVSPATLRGLLAHHPGPEPKFTHRGLRTPSCAWYDPAEMRAWWAKLHA